MDRNKHRGLYRRPESIPSPPATYALRFRADERQGGSGQVPFLLAERAHSESARSMRAVKGNLDHSL